MSGSEETLVTVENIIEKYDLKKQLITLANLTQYSCRLFRK